VVGLERDRTPVVVGGVEDTVGGGVVGGVDERGDGTVVVVVLVLGLVPELVAGAPVVGVFRSTDGGVARPGSGVPAISPAPVADAGVTRGTPGAGGCLGIGGMLNSSRASRAMVAKVGADAAAP
jgi:hypothetical protein